MEGLPKFWTWLFKKLCNDSFYEELQGDLEERFYVNLEGKGIKKAKSFYRREVIKMVRPSVIKKPKFIAKMFRFSLLNIHVKLSFRNLWRNKVFSTVNILGLGAAMATCLFVVNLLYTGNNLDTVHSNHKDIYRVITETQGPNGFRAIIASSPPPISQKLRDDFPEIDIATQIIPRRSEKFDIKGGEVLGEGFHTDPQFFSIFNFSTVLGNTDKVFSDINSIAITDELAQRLFPNENPIGKTTVGGRIIRAVIQSPKGLSHLTFDFIGNIKSGNNRFDKNSWDRFAGTYNYFKLKAKSSIGQVNQKLVGTSQAANESRKDKERTSLFKAQSINDIQFSDQMYNQLGTALSRSELLILIIPASLLLLLASFNYTNLSIARAIQRTKEIGIRKVTGSSRKQIIGQFLVETVVFSLIALIFSYLIYRLFVPEFLTIAPEFNGLINERLTIDMLLTFILFAIGVGLFAGIFPSLYFARISPLQAFNSKVKTKKISLIGMRKVLTGFQLTLSMFGILFISIGYSQYQAMMNAPYGFTKDGILNIQSSAQEIPLLKQKLLEIPEVAAVTVTSSIPGTTANVMMEVKNEDRSDSIDVRFAVVDVDFNKVFRPKLIRGEFFKREVTGSDQKEILVDKMLLERFQIPLDSALGYLLNKNSVKYEIVGVLDDLVFGGIELEGNVPVIVINDDMLQITKSIAVKLNTTNTLATITKIEEAYAEIHEGGRLKVEFVDKIVRKSFDEVLNIIKVVSFLAIMIIGISLLGQLGMALYNAETKVKEIGIRKVLGAETRNIMALLLKGTGISLLIASLLASPLVYKFFQDVILIHLRVATEIGVLEILRGIIFLTGLVVSVVVIQTWRVASQNPSQSLRNE